MQAVQHRHAGADGYRVSLYVRIAISLRIVTRDVEIDGPRAFAVLRHGYPLTPALAMTWAAMAPQVPRPSRPSPTMSRTKVIAFSAAGFRVNSNRMVRR